MAYGLNAVAVASWAQGDHEQSLAAHAEAVLLVEEIHDQWGLALCKVLQARTLFDLGDPGAGTVATEGVEHARRAGDLHVLGIALTQIAQLAMSEGDPADAVTAAEEALALQERIGYTEGTVSALHVLGQAHRLVGEVEEARALHQRALRLASRIGHAVAMCEAMEDLARTDAADKPEVALMLIRAARAERSARGLPMRQRDAEELAVLEEALVSGAGAPAPDRPFATLVAELAG
jgi:tetratricopeptide (TPR) repeat protein